MATCEKASVLMAPLKTVLSELHKLSKNVCYLFSLWSLRLLLILVKVRTA